MRNDIIARDVKTLVMTMSRNISRVRRSLKKPLQFPARYNDTHNHAALPRRNYANGNASGNTRDYTLRDMHSRVDIERNTDALYRNARETENLCVFGIPVWDSRWKNILLHGEK